MRHIVELKMPKLFGKKKHNNDESEIRTEVDLNEQIETVDIPQPIFVVGLVVTTLTVGYLIGYQRGINNRNNIVIVKS